MTQQHLDSALAGEVQARGWAQRHEGARHGVLLVLAGVTADGNGHGVVVRLARAHRHVRVRSTRERICLPLGHLRREVGDGAQGTNALSELWCEQSARSVAWMRKALLRATGSETNPLS